MKRQLASGLVGFVIIMVAVVPSVAAATTWTARIGSYGVATIRVGSPDKLSIGAKNFRPRIAYTVTLRRGSCATAGTLVFSTRLTSSSTGTIARTLYLTSAQTRAAKLPLVIRIGTRCGVFAAPTPTPTPTPTPGTFGNGTYIVGTAIQAGTYRTDGGSSCYWKRLSGFGGTLDEIIANNFGGGSQIVTIAATDTGFSSSDCGTWKLQSPPIPAPLPAPGTFGDGTWRVTIDIPPGTYQSVGGTTSCYWKRLSGFGGTLSEILANDFGTVGAVVTISPTDAGFAARDCGLWTLLY